MMFVALAHGKSYASKMGIPNKLTSCLSGNGNWMQQGASRTGTVTRWLSGRRMSRTERRLMERKQRNKEKRELKAPKEEVTAEKKVVELSPFQKRIKNMVYPKIFGSGAFVTSEHLIALGYRLPFFLALAYLLTDEDFSPYVVKASLGPSMLPTIPFIGDLWLVETGAWYRWLGWAPSLERGQVILWKDETNGRVSCKRVVGIGGDDVLRYGEFGPSIYRSREDLAIIWPRDTEERGLDADFPWDSENNDDNRKDANRKIKVPDGHVWLEGDCPLFSLDSRHYGPIPVERIHGRLMLRLWPMTREDHITGEVVPNWVSTSRPRPFPKEDDYLGKQYNFYRVPKVAPKVTDDQEEESVATENEQP
eukprot:Nitzschia sp. Nitz4//scaffold9_size221794//144733//145824//NITZ4_001365-RA/size221794-processed-gene-0.337-mRNA-1//-1//CDS//3329561058//759//frame0